MIRNLCGAVLTAALIISASPPAPAAAVAQIAPESAVIGMPFDGNWANRFGTHPDVHSRRSDQDWTIDVFAVSQPVTIEIAEATGDVTMLVDRVELDATCGSTGGTYVQVDVSVDAVPVGRVLYHHLVDVAVAEGDSVEAGDTLGFTVATPGALSGPCWRVSTEFGIHTHFAATNVEGWSCYFRYDIGEALVAGAPFAHLGAAEDGRSVGSGVRSACGETDPQVVHRCKNRVATIVGTNGDDQLTGTAGDDVIVGLGGDDTIVALGGHDVVCAGDGDDTVFGGDGHDFIKGEAGDDALSGGADHDKLAGGPGNDRLQGNRGTDHLAGQLGNDLLRGGGGPDKLFGHAGDDVLSGGAGADRLWGDAGNDELRGGRGPDIMGGGSNVDSCDGGANQSDAADATCEGVVAVP